jgi:hypothetical protein
MCVRQLIQDFRHLRQVGELVEPCLGLDVSKDVDPRCVWLPRLDLLHHEAINAVDCPEAMSLFGIIASSSASSCCWRSLTWSCGWVCVASWSSLLSPDVSLASILSTLSWAGVAEAYAPVPAARRPLPWRVGERGLLVELSSRRARTAVSIGTWCSNISVVPSGRPRAPSSSSLSSRRALRLGAPVG